MVFGTVVLVGDHTHAAMSGGARVLRSVHVHSAALFTGPRAQCRVRGDRAHAHVSFAGGHAHVRVLVSGVWGGSRGPARRGHGTVSAMSSDPRDVAVTADGPRRRWAVRSATGAPSGPARHAPHVVGCVTDDLSGCRRGRVATSLTCDDRCRCRRGHLARPGRTVADPTSTTDIQAVRTPCMFL